MILLSQVTIIFCFLKLLNSVLGQGDWKDAAEAGSSEAGIRTSEDEMVVKDKKDGSSQEITRLEDFLAKSWQELDRMLFCTKLPMCVIRYQKKFRIGKKYVRANLIQSLTLTLHQIKDITAKLKNLKRYNFLAGIFLCFDKKHLYLLLSVDWLVGLQNIWIFRKK